MSDLSRYADQEIIDIISSDAETELKKRGYAYGWYKKDCFVGAIYILVNPAFLNLVKIGYADDVEKRLKSLNSSSGLPDPYHCYAIYKVKKRLEDLKLHGLIDSLDSSLRHAKNREFYEMDTEKAYSILSAIAEINGNEEQLVLNPFNDSYFLNDKVKQNNNIISSNVSLLNIKDTKMSLNMKYWNAYNAYVSKSPKYLKEFSLRKPSDRFWMDFAIGSVKYHLTINIMRKNKKLIVGLYICSDKNIYNILLNKKDLIESNLGYKLNWLPKVKAFLIYISNSFDISNENEWINQFDWLMETLIKMKYEFKKYI